MFFQYFAAHLVVVLFIAFVSGQLPLRSEHTPSRVSHRIEGGADVDKCANINCTTTGRVSPTARRSELVCASDGLTYTKCEFSKAQCEGHRIAVKYEGWCQGLKLCFSVRAQARLQWDGESGFLPECKPDGSYAPVQCHPSGYCWCVDGYGKNIAGSTVPAGQTPNCQQHACGPSDLEVFNSNLLHIFLSELKMHSGIMLDATDKKGDDTSIGMRPELYERVRAARWKFQQLDQDGDGFLQRKELRDTKRMIRRIVSPRSCVKDMIKRCDMDRDRKTALTEWFDCLHVHAEYLPRGGGSGSNGSFGGVAADGAATPDEEGVDYGEGEEHQMGEEDVTSSHQHSSASANAKDDGGDVLDCRTAKRNALDSHRQMERHQESDSNASSSPYIPQCDAEGNYNEVQCHFSSGFCWCVQAKTGRPIRGSAKKHANRHDCETAKRQSRLFKGCSFKKKQLFIKELVTSFHFDLNPNLTHNETERLLKQSNVWDGVIRWKFGTLDANRNDMLERDEWKAFRRQWKPFLTGGVHRKGMRKCWRNFLRYCDVNDDRSLTEDEWQRCTDISVLQETATTAAPVEQSDRSSSRRGPNPFNTILIS